MMNLSQFLKAVDNATTKMTKEKLAEVIHDIARTLPEEARRDFLTRLGGEEYEKTEKTEARQEILRECFIQSGKALKEDLERIENGELLLEGRLNEEYDDWYDSDADEFLYSDPEGIQAIIEEACRYVHQCIEREEYEAGSEIAEILIGLEIMVGGEYLDYTDDPIKIDDLGYYHLGNVDYKSLVVDAAHVVYCACTLSERAEALYDIIENSGRKDITLEMIMQNGRELPNIDAFLPLWIEYLGGMTTSNAENLLHEALELAGDGQRLLDSARKYCGDHPELYEQYLQSSRGKVDEASLLEVSAEAMEAIDQKYLVRSRIALLASRIALELDRQEVAETYWLEAFRSDTRVVNYLRLLVECRDFSEMREATEKIYQGKYPQPDAAGFFYTPAVGGKENQVNVRTAYMLAFLGKEFSYVRENAMNVKDSLGWSASFMKCGLAAFLLLLTESVELAAGGREMLRQVVAAVGFDKAEYEKGTLSTIEESNEAWFWKCWLHWKKTVLLSEEEREELLQWSEGLVTRRVNGIMEGNHRKYYWECAAYIAALGEAEESGGEQNGKQRAMEQYMELYPRRSAFREELRRYGMRDSRKKK